MGFFPVGFRWFSNCSRTSIGAVLSAKAQNCFTGQCLPLSRPFPPPFVMCLCVPSSLPPPSLLPPLSLPPSLPPPSLLPPLSLPPSLPPSLQFVGRGVSGDYVVTSGEQCDAGLLGDTCCTDACQLRSTAMCR